MLLSVRYVDKVEVFALDTKSAFCLFSFSYDK